MKYQALISAKTREEAIEIASEAVGPERRIVRSEAIDVSDAEGPDSWQVTLVLSASGSARDPSPG